jgi:hypothetical protein
VAADAGNFDVFFWRLMYLAPSVVLWTTVMVRAQEAGLLPPAGMA